MAALFDAGVQNVIAGSGENYVAAWWRPWLSATQALAKEFVWWMETGADVMIALDASKEWLRGQTWRRVIEPKAYADALQFDTWTADPI